MSALKILKSLPIYIYQSPLLPIQDQTEDSSLSIIPSPFRGRLNAFCRQSAIKYAIQELISFAHPFFFQTCLHGKYL